MSIVSRSALPSVLVALLTVTSLTAGYSQGCSDAGFCTMGAMKPDQPFNKKLDLRLRSMELSLYRGTTKLTPVIYVATVDLNFSLNKKTSFQLKVPYQMVRGKLANTSGLGDLSLCVTRTVHATEKFDVNVTLGGKIATNGSDKKDNTYPLPMYYQTSLGTYDFIAGVSLISRKWLLATGIQHPFNKTYNKFIWSRWEGGPERMDYVTQYPTAYDLKRGTDVMLRLERNFRFSRLNFAIGALPIFRINRDITSDREGHRIKQNGTTGMALSGIFTTGYSFNVRSGIKLLIGHKVRQRKINPDGLSREFVSTISYYYRF